MLHAVRCAPVWGCKHRCFLFFFTVQCHAVHACKSPVRALEVCLSVCLPVLLFKRMMRVCEPPPFFSCVCLYLLAYRFANVAL